MTRLLFAALALLVAAVGATAQTSQLPTLLSRAIAASESARAPYAFNLEYSSGAQGFTARFEPRAAPRLQRVSPRRDALSDDLRTDFDYFSENLSGVTWCAAPNMGRIADVRLVREDETTAVYSFQPTRDSVTGAQTRRVVAHLRGELSILKASSDISRIHLYAPRPFSPTIGANVELYTLTFTCAPAPNGRYYASEIVHESRGAGFGRSFDTRTVRRVRDLAPPA
jgi:hypothetical protein